MTLEKAHISKKTRDQTQEALSLRTGQLDQARTTVTQHTADIAHIKSLLEDCESTDGESSFLEESAASEPGVDNNPPPQGLEDENPPENPPEDLHDIEMRDVEDDSNPIPPQEQDNNPLPVPITQSDSPPKDEEDNDGTKDYRCDHRR